MFVVEMSAEIVPGKGWNLTGRSHAAFHRLDHPNSALPWPQLFRADDVCLEHQIIRPEVKQIAHAIVNSHKTSIETLLVRCIRKPVGRNKLNGTQQQGCASPEVAGCLAYGRG